MTEKKSMDARARLKNPGLALLLAFIFGGLGVFHLSIGGGILLFAVDMVIYYLGAHSNGFGLLLLVPWRAIALLFAMKAVTIHNRKILDMQQERTTA